ncbi:OsmC family peroxiredoxin [Actinomadura sp. 3N407]|uniref:OsmC family peroxiredoxin n=1 Tax=Actinomadura sp. 3N407 TaxID=3457423 RepID=UPI003FCC7ED2
MSSIQRTAHAVWQGALDTGHGELSAESGAFTDLVYTFASRTAEKPEHTDPEELLAAAHAGCFAMALNSELTQGKATPARIEVSAEVTLGPTPEGRRITHSSLTVEARFDQAVEPDWFQGKLGAADRRCPFSALVRASGAVEVSGTVVR